MLYKRPFVQFHHLVFLIIAKRLSKTGGLGKEHWGRVTTTAASLSEGKAPLLTPFFWLKEALFLLLSLYKEEKYQTGANKGDFIM